MRLSCFSADRRPTWRSAADLHEPAANAFAAYSHTSEATEYSSTITPPNINPYSVWVIWRNPHA